MKTISIIILCSFFSITIFGQKPNQVDKDQLTTPKLAFYENTATTLEDDNSVIINNYLEKHFICPLKAKECCIEGREIVKFVVNPSGELTNFEVVNSVCREIDTEIIRVLKSTEGMWIPGQNNGNAIAMEKEVSMLFAACSAEKVEDHFTDNAKNYFEQGCNRLLVHDNPKKALRSFNKGMRYLPNDDALLVLRGLCKYELGDEKGANKDWNRMKNKGLKSELSLIYNDFQKMKGYSKLAEVLN